MSEEGTSRAELDDIAPDHGEDLAPLLARNRAWANAKTGIDPTFFSRLVGQQRPRYFWIGCSDSRVPATEIVDLDPGEMFVHRNVANLAIASDANFAAALQFAVEALEVEHIIVVGHYGCGGIQAAMAPRTDDAIGKWLEPVRALYQSGVGARPWQRASLMRAQRRRPGRRTVSEFDRARRLGARGAAGLAWVGLCDWRWLSPFGLRAKTVLDALCRTTSERIAPGLPMLECQPAGPIEVARLACERADQPSRELDAEIAIAIFPSLAELESLAPGVWRQADGTHARALRYSSSWDAAASIVPPGYWIERAPCGPRVVGPCGEWEGSHEADAIALCIAALGARLGQASA